MFWQNVHVQLSGLMFALLLQGGLIIARADRTDINQVQDLKGKVVEAQVFSSRFDIYGLLNDFQTN